MDPDDDFPILDPGEFMYFLMIFLAFCGVLSVRFKLSRDAAIFTEIILAWIVVYHAVHPEDLPQRVPRHRMHTEPLIHTKKKKKKKKG